MAHIDLLLARNRELVAAGDRPVIPLLPPHKVFLVSCLDPRVDPAAVFGLAPGDVMQVRNAGGRVTTEVLHDLALIGELAAMMAGPEQPLFEIAVVHHTQCGTGFLADEGFRRQHATRTGEDEAAVAARAVLDPQASVRADVALLHASPAVPDRATVSGHVHDLETGLVTTVVPATAKGAV